LLSAGLGWSLGIDRFMSSRMGDVLEEEDGAAASDIDGGGKQ
jgi:hypothetical protein